MWNTGEAYIRSSNVFFILNENYIKPITRRKFVEIEESSQEALARFKTEIANSEIYDKLRKDLSTDPNDNIKFYRRF